METQDNQRGPLDGPIKPKPVPPDLCEALTYIFDDILTQAEEFKVRMAQGNFQRLDKVYPDAWLNLIMLALRGAAMNILDYQGFRKAIIKAAALCVLVVQIADEVYKEKSMPLPTVIHPPED